MKEPKSHSTTIHIPFPVVDESTDHFVASTERKEPQYKKNVGPNPKGMGGEERRGRHHTKDVESRQKDVGRESVLDLAGLKTATEVWVVRCG